MAITRLLALALHLEVLVAEPACPEGEACLAADDVDEVSMLQKRHELASSRAVDDGAASAEFVVENDVPYGSLDQQKVDVYSPASSDLKPDAGWSAVIILPGTTGDKSGFKEFCTQTIVPSGRVCVAAMYRKSDSYRNRDVYEVADWFHKKAGDWDVDKTNIVLGGVSLGGLTINNVIWDKNLGKDLLRGSAPKIRAVLFLSGTWSSHKNKAKKAKYFPLSTFICSSDTDTQVPYKYSKDLYKELDKKGLHVKFVTIYGAGHSIWYSGYKKEGYREILAFLDETVPPLA